MHQLSDDNPSDKILPDLKPPRSSHNLSRDQQRHVPSLSCHQKKTQRGSGSETLRECRRNVRWARDLHAVVDHDLDTELSIIACIDAKHPKQWHSTGRVSVWHHASSSTFRATLKHKLSVPFVEREEYQASLVENQEALSGTPSCRIGIEQKHF